MHTLQLVKFRMPLVVSMVQDLVRKSWITNHRSLEDRRAVSLQLSRIKAGSGLAIQHEKIKQGQVLQFNMGSLVRARRFFSSQWRQDPFVDSSDLLQ